MVAAAGCRCFWMLGRGRLRKMGLCSGVVGLRRRNGTVMGFVKVRGGWMDGVDCESARNFEEGS